MKTALAGSILVCALFMGATCWHWSGVKARAMDLEQALEAANHQHDVAARLHRQAVEILLTLEAMAAENSVRAAHARHALNDLATKLRK